MPLAEVGWSGRKRPTENWQGFYDKTEMMGRGAGAGATPGCTWHDSRAGRMRTPTPLTPACPGMLTPCSEDVNPLSYL
jgi:hypothetical protein